MNFKQAVISLALLESICNGNNNKNCIYFDVFKRRDKFRFRHNQKTMKFRFTWKRSVLDIITDPKSWML